MSTVAELAKFDPQPRSLNDVVRVIQQLGQMDWVLSPPELPASPASDGKDYYLKITDGVLSWVLLTKELPDLPASDGHKYFLQVVDGVLSWVDSGAC